GHLGRDRLRAALQRRLVALGAEHVVLGVYDSGLDLGAAEIDAPVDAVILDVWMSGAMTVGAFRCPMGTSPRSTSTSGCGSVWRPTAWSSTSPTRSRGSGWRPSTTTRCWSGSARGR